ncbi:hypothetical protein ACFE04_012616 [Oxalis oulophora]
MDYVGKIRSLRWEKSWDIVGILHVVPVKPGLVRYLLYQLSKTPHKKHLNRMRVRPSFVKKRESLSQEQLHVPDSRSFSPFIGRKFATIIVIRRESAGKTISNSLLSAQGWTPWNFIMSLDLQKPKRKLKPFFTTPN